MLQDINEKTFSRESIDEDLSVEEAVKKLRKLRFEKIEVFSVTRELSVNPWSKHTKY